eukprot:scpid2194/ scgid21752/ 
MATSAMVRQRIRQQTKPNVGSDNEATVPISEHVHSRSAEFGKCSLHSYEYATQLQASSSTYRKQRTLSTSAPNSSEQKRSERHRNLVVVNQVVYAVAVVKHDTTHYSETSAIASTSTSSSSTM